MTERFKTFECEHCRKEVRTRLPHATRVRARVSGTSPEMWCLKCAIASSLRSGVSPCVDVERRSAGGGTGASSCDTCGEVASTKPDHGHEVREKHGEWRRARVCSSCAPKRPMRQASLFPSSGAA